MRNQADQTHIHFDDALNKIPVGRFHIRLLLLCGLGFAACTMEMTLLGFLLTALREEWEISEVSFGLMNTLVQATGILGQCLFGPIADIFGRRGVFLASVVLGVIGGGISALAPNLVVLVLARMLVTFGLGGSIVVDFSLFSEFLPTHARGRFLIIMACFWPLGQILECLLAWSLLPTCGWRVFVAASALPALVAAFFRPWMPESARWLLTQGRQEEATEIMRAIGEECGEDCIPVGSVLHLGADSCKDASPSVIQLLQRLVSRALLPTTLGLVCYCWTLEMSSYVALTLMPTLLETKGLEGQGMYFSMTLSSISCGAGVGLALLFAMYSIGRLRSMQFFVVALCVCLFVFSFAGAKASVGFSCLASAFLEGGWALFQAYGPEVYPTRVRATAVGTVSSLGSLLSLVAPLPVSVVLKWYGSTPAVCSLVGACIILGILSTFVLLQVETLGRDLDDVSFEDEVQAPVNPLQKLEKDYGAARC
mmetsp:Transcript_10653/g.24238  ORF Transcript_10653/g.24238 Transcript_10653/m.24238 type:complete len:481 (-) Transcript_10653:33-1475(-)